MPYIPTSPFDEPRNAAERWTRLIEIYLDVLGRDTLGQEIEALGNKLGLGDGYYEDSSGWILRTAFELNPEKALAFYQRVNPEIDLEHLTGLSVKDEYKVAVGLVCAYAHEEDDEESVRMENEATGTSGAERLLDEKVAMRGPIAVNTDHNSPEGSAAFPTPYSGASPEQVRQFIEDTKSGIMGRLLVEALNKGALKDQEDEANR